MDELLGRRKTQRVSLAVPLLISSRSPQLKFHGGGETVNVSMDGALIKVLKPLPYGATIRIDIPNTNRHSVARVIRMEGSERDGWKIGVQLMQPPGNFWDIASPPRSWSRYAETAWRG